MGVEGMGGDNYDDMRFDHIIYIPVINCVSFEEAIGIWMNIQDAQVLGRAWVLMQLRLNRQCSSYKTKELSLLKNC